MFRPYNLTSLAAWTVGCLAGNAAYYRTKGISQRSILESVKNSQSILRLNLKLSAICDEINSITDRLRSCVDNSMATVDLTPLIHLIVYYNWFEERKAGIRIEAKKACEQSMSGIRDSGPLLELPQPFQTTVPPNGKRSDDHLDFAFVRLSDSLADEIAKGRYFLPFELIDANDSFKPRTRYLFSGFPSSREKTDYKRKKVKPSRFSFTGVAVPITRMSLLGLHVDAHIVVEFERDNVMDSKGQTARFPSPKGMSGGAVWHGDGDFRLWLYDLPAKLVGIGIENPENKNVLVAVRIHLVLAAISKVYPDIEKFVPKRFGFKSEISVVPWKPLSKIR